MKNIIKVTIALATIAMTITTANAQSKFITWSDAGNGLINGLGMGGSSAIQSTKQSATAKALEIGAVGAVSGGAQSIVQRKQTEKIVDQKIAANNAKQGTVVSTTPVVVQQAPVVQAAPVQVAQAPAAAPAVAQELVNLNGQYYLKAANGVLTPVSVVSK